MLTLKELAYRLEMPTRSVSYRARRGQIPGAVATGKGTRTRWTFPDQAADLRGKLPPIREPRNQRVTACKHCGERFTTPTTYTQHRRTVTKNGTPIAECMDAPRLKLAGLMQNDRGEWKKRT